MRASGGYPQQICHITTPACDCQWHIKPHYANISAMEENVTPIGQPQSSDATENITTHETLAPHNIEAEQALLGALLINNNVYEQFSAFLLAEHFFDPVHARIYRAISKLINNNNLASLITLQTYLESDAGLRELGGRAYLGQLIQQATTLVNAAQYAREIFEFSRRRGLIDAGTDMITNARDINLDKNTDKQIENAEASLYKLSERGNIGGDFENFQNSIVESVKFANYAFSQVGSLSGLGTSFVNLDDKLGGLQKSDLIVLAARPSMGKTALATNIAFHIARELLLAKKGSTETDALDHSGKGGIVGFFSLEMSAEQLATRIIAEQARILSSKIRKGAIDQIDYDKFVKIARDLADLPLYIDDTSSLPISTLTTRARRLKRQHGLDLIIVDYLQLLKPTPGQRDQGRVQEISEITQGLKALAKDLNVPVIAVSQLSRQVESRDDKRPQLSDLRDSGTIEQDADIVMFIYREAYYEARKKPEEGTPEHIKWQEKMDKINHQAELIIGKNRHGPIGNISLKFEAKFTRFSEPDSEMGVPPQNSDQFPD